MAVDQISEKMNTSTPCKSNQIEMFGEKFNLYILSQNIYGKE